ncbi:MAG: TadE/TadG family type IV pilus assembly protein [Panacagrimonas sp.]
MTPSRPQREGGAAAVEFAIAFPVLFLMLYGLITFGATLYTQQAVSGAVHDAARAVALLPIPAGVPRDYTLIKTEVIESLAGTAIAPSASNGTRALRRTWLDANVRSRITVVEAACVGVSGGTCATITLSFPYGNTAGTRLLPAITIPGVGGTESWMPSTLSSAATVRL